MAALLATDAARAGYLAAAPDLLARYRWANTAMRTLALIEEAGGA
jgi:hypothetical protein